MKEENNTYSLRKVHKNCSSLLLIGQWTTRNTENYLMQMRFCICVVMIYEHQRVIAMKTLPQIKKHSSNDIWAPVGNYNENITTNIETSK
jgi:hypothetical protein